MLKSLFFSIVLSLLTHTAFAITDSSLYHETPSYPELIERYKQLDKDSKYARLIPCGETDGGHTMHLFVITKSELFNPKNLHDAGITVLMINNGIHPGEPDGINASLLLAEKLLADDGKMLPDKVALCIVPVMNIEGAIERNCCSRVSQNGPSLYGFRGNGLYLDLNRDFIKADSYNTRSWLKVFRQWDPHVLMDTHVSDGADFQYTMTLIATQHNKLYPEQGEYLKNKLTPMLYQKMKKRGEEMGPYVETFEWNLPPDSGIVAFLETPRYSTGYAALFNTIGFISESHMVKPFKDRVIATLHLLESLMELCAENSGVINNNKSMARKTNQYMTHFAVNWKPDKNKVGKINFKGYEHEYKTSKVTGLPALFYDRDKPIERKIPYYGEYFPADTIAAPLYYVIPRSWKRVLQILHNNDIRMIQSDMDSVTIAEVYYIDDFKTTENAYEGHYLHYDTKVLLKTDTVNIRKGDFLVPVFQEGSRYIIETLEPICTDSYFNWGFFDAILQQKEWYSGFAFEETAGTILEQDPDLNLRFNEMKKSDPAFSASSFSQLYYIYRNSKYFEEGFRRYPVYRIGNMPVINDSGD
jgi:hypothetical protein